MYHDVFVPRPSRLVAAFMSAWCACSATFTGSSESEPDAATTAAVIDRPDVDSGVSIDIDIDAESEACALEFYRDDDSDGFGDATQMITDCQSPVGYVANADDCDDRVADINPEAEEVCGDQIDNDCVGGDACADSLVAHWLSDPGGEQVIDVSGAGHTATLHNGAVTSAADGLVLDGVDDYVEIAHDDRFTLDNGTLSLWFRTTSSDAFGLWSKDSQGFDGGGHLTLYTLDGGGVRLRIQSIDMSYGASHVAATGNGSWQHVVATFGSGGVQLYLNGELVASNAYVGGTQGNREPIAMGAATTYSGNLSTMPIDAAFPGNMSDVRFYDRALSVLEVTQLHTTGRRTSDPPPVIE